MTVDKKAVVISKLYFLDDNDLPSSIQGDWKACTE